MESYLRRRTDRMEVLMNELESETETVRSMAQKLMTECWMLMYGMQHLEGNERPGDYLSAYPSIYDYLVRCSDLMSEITCKIEVLVKENPGVSSVRSSAPSGAEFDMWMEKKISAIHAAEKETRVEKLVENKAGPASASDPEGSGTLSARCFRAEATRSDQVSSVVTGKMRHRRAEKGRPCGEELGGRTEREEGAASRETVGGPGPVKGREKPHEGVEGDDLPGRKATVPRSSGFSSEAAPLPEVDPELGAVYEGELVHSVSPDEFYVRIHCEETAAANGDMPEKTTAAVAAGERKKRGYGDESLSHRKRKALASAAVGSHGIAFCEGRGEWSKVAILDWRLSAKDDLVLVSYADRVDCLPLRLLWPMAPAFRVYPPRVQKCYLPFIRPFRPGKNGDERWSEEDRTAFETLTECGEELFRVKIQVAEWEPCREDAALGVILTLFGSEVNINDKLVEYGIAKVDRPEHPTPCKRRERVVEETGSSSS